MWGSCCVLQPPTCGPTVLFVPYSLCQEQLPATGVPITRQRFDQMRSMFDDYVRSSTLHNWKFWIVSFGPAPASHCPFHHTLGPLSPPSSVWDPSFSRGSVGDAWRGHAQMLRRNFCHKRATRVGINGRSLRSREATSRAELSIAT